MVRESHPSCPRDGLIIARSASGGLTWRRVITIIAMPHGAPVLRRGWKGEGTARARATWPGNVKMQRARERKPAISASRARTFTRHPCARAEPDMRAISMGRDIDTRLESYRILNDGSLRQMGSICVATRCGPAS